MDLHYRTWRLPIKYFLNIAWVDCNILSRDDMSQKQNFLQPKSTLAELGIELMVSKSLQNNSEILRMLLFTLGIDQDVINEDHDKLVQLWHEHGVHQVHKMCRSMVSPNDITKYSYNPYLVKNAVLETSSGRILI
jgi:hypothetical protein